LTLGVAFFLLFRQRRAWACAAAHLSPRLLEIIWTQSDETGYMSQRGYSYHPIRTAWIMSCDSLKLPTIANALNRRIRSGRLQQQRRSHYHYQCGVIIVVVVIVVAVVHWPPRDRQHINNNNYQSAYRCDPRVFGHGCLYDYLTFCPADRRRA